MNPPPQESLSSQYFAALYRDDADPWKFATSDYEAKKYAATIAALPKPRYRSAFEIGGSIGVLTERLADRCDALLSVDISEMAQQKAIERCRMLPQVRFQCLNVLESYPNEQFDLTVLSEVGYYWSLKDLKLTQQRMLKQLEPGGHLLLVHWTPYDELYHNPLSGDEVHEAFLALVPTKLRHLTGQREAQYRLDLFERI